MKKIDIDDLKQYVQTLETMNAFKDKLKKQKEIFEKDNSVTIRNIQTASEKLLLLKTNIMTQAQTEFRATGDKQLLGGIGIRETDVYDFDEIKALDWAKEHSLCLTLDKKAFAQIVKVQDLPFVTKSNRVYVTFPKEINLEGDE